MISTVFGASDYKAQNEKELSFETGDKLLVIKSDQNGYLFGRRCVDGRVGYFPEAETLPEHIVKVTQSPFSKKRLRKTLVLAEKKKRKKFGLCLWLILVLRVCLLLGVIRIRRSGVVLIVCLFFGCVW